MRMHGIDWVIVALPFVLVVLIAVKARRYVKGVGDFLAAGRCAGRYLVCNAVGEASMGAISVVALFEMIYRSGFVVGWWQTLATPVILLMTLSGFVVYRYRETRAMTMAQFFEMRYSRRFRVFAGILCSISGILNYAIFPAVGARFVIYYCGFPQALWVGGWHVPTLAVVMAILLGSSVFFTLMGGQLVAMVADCVEGLISLVMYLVVAGMWGRSSAVALLKWPWRLRQGRVKSYSNMSPDPGRDRTISGDNPLRLRRGGIEIRVQCSG